MAVEPARIRLGRIRCLTHCVECMIRRESLPQALCFVPKIRDFEYLEEKEPLCVFEEAKTESKVIEKLGSTKFTCSGLPAFNSDGGWMLMTFPHKGWVLLEPQKGSIGGKVKVLTESKDPQHWMQVVEQTYALHIGNKPQIADYLSEEVEKLQTPPPGWSLETDETLAQFLLKYTMKDSFNISGLVKGVEYISRIEASSSEEMISDLLDPDLENFYWESDGERGRHWIRFHMVPGIVIDTFSLVVDPDDDTYLPRRVIVKGGTRGNMSVLTTRNFNTLDYDTRELQLFLSPLTAPYAVIEVHIKSCSGGGLYCRIRGVSLTVKNKVSSLFESEDLSEDIFEVERIARYPKLQPFDKKQLFYRGIVLKRIAALLDKDFSFLLPRPRFSSGKLDVITAIRQLWPLAQSRNSLIKELISDTTTKAPHLPSFYVNRMAAKEHRDDPSKDQDCKKTVFVQIIQEMKKRTKPSSFNFRWAGHWTQWWECKFIQEGVIDQGGGFRDTFAEIAEELCPSDMNSVPALPLFIRSPNQSQDSSNVHRDAYILNPGCEQYSWYHFVGQLMGAMFRSQESLVLSLPQFFWKQLIGDTVTWARDFVSVDSAEVKLIDSIESMTQETFEASFEGTLRFTTVASNGDTKVLIPGGREKLVTYGDRLDYCKLVKEYRMKESSKQMEAIRKGLVSVVPAEVLDLLTWQEMELRVCGNPEITIKALKASTRYDSSLSVDSPQVKIMWDALEKFSNEDRSRFIRFVTGRRRLPCTIYIDMEYNDGKLPTSATCSSTLYLPSYKNVDEAVEKLRYAVYNCVAIDTDRDPWE